jgi:hypothetical protein
MWWNTLGDVIFYSGDIESNGPANLNQINFSAPDTTQYVNFTVPTGSQWQISAIFANTVYNNDGHGSLNSPPSTQAYYELRSDVAAGNDGVLIASGTVSATPILSGLGYFGYEQFLLQADLPAIISLDAGTYWEALVPVGNGDNYAYAYQTLGINSVNSMSNQSAYSTTSGGAYFASTSLDSSEGLLGTITSPEPTSLFLLGFGGVGIFARRRCAAAR